MTEVREQSSERIEHAATALFAEHGFGAVGVRDIARMAEVPVSAISYYFGSKEGLYRECTRKLTHEFVGEARESLDSGANLSELLAHHLEFGGGDSRLIKMWLDIQLSGEPDACAYSNREILGPIWGILSEALETDGDVTLDRRLGVLSFFGAVILGAILTDDQMASLTESPPAAAREKWRDEILDRFKGAGLVVEALQVAK